MEMDAYFAVMADRFESMARAVEASASSLAWTAKRQRRTGPLDEAAREAADALESLRAALASIEAARNAWQTPDEPY